MDSAKVKAIRQFLAAEKTAVTDMKYDSLRWRFRGKELKDVFNEINGKQYPITTVFRIDLKYLHYNFQNRRIAIYLKEREIEKKQNMGSYKSVTVSEDNEEDRIWVQNLLLGRISMIGVQSTTSDFEEELIKNSQLEPAAITFDGTLRNGNRRRAIFQDILDKIQKDVKGYNKLDPNQFRYMKVIILPESITDEELFDLENFLQTKKDWKQEYDSLSMLNIIKEAHEVFGLSFDKIRQKYLHNKSVREIEKGYNKVKKMDEYLDHIDKPGQYSLIKSQQELFADNVNYDFEGVGLKKFQREDKNLQSAVMRKRKELFFDIVAVNRCNNELFKPSEIAVRELATQIFQKRASDPKKTVEILYQGIDKNKLRSCDHDTIHTFANKINYQILSHKKQNISLQPLEKLKKITKDISKFKPTEIQSLATKNETGKEIRLMKQAIDNLEKKIGKFALR